MKKVLLILLCFFAAALGGCLRQGEKEAVMPEAHSEELVETSTQTIPEEEQGKEQWNYENNVVKITCGSLIGSGIVYREQEDSLILLTARHCILPHLENQEAGVYLMKNEDICRAKVLEAYEDIDLAILSVKREEPLTEKLQPIKQAASYPVLMTGDPIVIVGALNDPSQDCYEGEVVQPFVYHEAIGRNVLLARGTVYPGMSGGAVYSVEGEFLGMISGIYSQEQEETTFVAIPGITIHSLDF